MEMNSDRQVLMNLNKNNNLNISNLERQKYNSNNKEEKNKIPIKPNSSFNYREAPKEKNGFVKLNNNKNKNIFKNRSKQAVIPKKTPDKKIAKNNEKDTNFSNNNLLNRFKTDLNKNKNNSKKKPTKANQNISQIIMLFHHLIQKYFQLYTFYLIVLIIHHIILNHQH